jgi:hypothetical protein
MHDDKDGMENRLSNITSKEMKILSIDAYGGVKHIAKAKEEKKSTGGGNGVHWVSTVWI